ASSTAETYPAVARGNTSPKRQRRDTPSRRWRFGLVFLVPKLRFGNGVSAKRRFALPHGETETEFRKSAFPNIFLVPKLRFGNGVSAKRRFALPHGETETEFRKSPFPNRSLGTRKREKPTDCGPWASFLPTAFCLLSALRPAELFFRPAQQLLPLL